MDSAIRRSYSAIQPGQGTPTQQLAIPVDQALFRNARLTLMTGRLAKRCGVTARSLSVRHRRLPVRDDWRALDCSRSLPSWVDLTEEQRCILYEGVTGSTVVEVLNG